MNILTICSALNNSYLGFYYEGKTINKIIKSDEKNYHSLYLISKIKEILKSENIDLNKIDYLAVNTGPGSFTGIRVALCIAKVMAGVLNKPLIPLTTSEILLEAFDCDSLIMDARRDLYFVSNRDDYKIELVQKDKVLDKLKGKILSDKRCLEIVKNALCFEDTDLDLADTMVKLALKKIDDSKNTDKQFNYLSVNANYIQTPPVF